MRKSHTKETREKISNSVRSFIQSHPERIGFKKGHRINVGRKYSPERNHKISGANHYNWKGGVTTVNEKLRHSQEYKLWRKAVFERDNYGCVWCGAHNGEGKDVVLHADHIKPWALFPELRFAIDNGRTLCVPCHETTDSYKKRL